MADAVLNESLRSRPNAASSSPILTVRDLSLSFDTGGPQRSIVLHNVSLSIHPHQVLAVVGESGSGKSLTALSILRLVPEPPSRIESGSIIFQGVDLRAATQAQMRSLRGRRIAMIFQEPMTSLNPVHSVGWQIEEAIRLHQNVSRSQARRLTIEAMQEVGIAESYRRVDQFPHQFSGGMRQRVMIAMALACKPLLLLADEPTTALDVTIASQILDLLHHLRRTFNMAIMLISHDLGVVARHADVVAVMYRGRIVEYAAAADLFANPMHPYTRALMRCAPRIGRRQDRLPTMADVLGADARASMFIAGHPDLVPSWSWSRPNDDPRGAAAPDEPAVLAQVAPWHWVACVPTPHAQSCAEQPPDVPPRPTVHARAHEVSATG